MKKFGLLVALLLCCSFIGCGSTPPSASKEQDKRIAKLEKGQNALQQSVTNLGTAMQQGFENTHQELDAINTQVNDIDAQTQELKAARKTRPLDEQLAEVDKNAAAVVKTAGNISKHGASKPVPTSTPTAVPGAMPSGSPDTFLLDRDAYLAACQADLEEANELLALSEFGARNDYRVPYPIRAFLKKAHEDLTSQKKDCEAKLKSMTTTVASAGPASGGPVPPTLYRRPERITRSPHPAGLTHTFYGWIGDRTLWKHDK